ncbi:MAG TPA: low affinity iron permease family protein [Pyrinomonadaceae bacterium]|nr:low affinity iron permease family protein [Pyrinomonadaceae bacterium]
MNEWFRGFSIAAANALGSSWMFIVNVLLILTWVVAGPFYNYSDSWQLIVNTGTTVLTYLAVFLIQNTQNRDAKAIHLKLDELIKGVEGARTHLVNLESFTDDELDNLQHEFERLRKTNRRVAKKLGSEHEEIREDIKDELQRTLEAVE